MGLFGKREKKAPTNLEVINDLERLDRKKFSDKHNQKRVLGLQIVENEMFDVMFNDTGSVDHFESLKRTIRKNNPNMSDEAVLKAVSDQYSGISILGIMNDRMDKHLHKIKTKNLAKFNTISHQSTLTPISQNDDIVQMDVTEEIFDPSVSTSCIIKTRIKNLVSQSESDPDKTESNKATRLDSNYNCKLVKDREKNNEYLEKADLYRENLLKKRVEAEREVVLRKEQQPTTVLISRYEKKTTGKKNATLDEVQSLSKDISNIEKQMYTLSGGKPYHYVKKSLKPKYEVLEKELKEKRSLIADLLRDK